MNEDPREAAMRYRLEKAAREDAHTHGADPDAAVDSGPDIRPPQGMNALQRAAIVESAIQQAIRRGDFDDLPGSGKPLEGLGDHHDPDWWIRRKIQTEQLTGLGPPALMLRAENAEFGQRADALTRPEDVRAYVEDFNRRIIEARRQLQGGPPVVTPTRDVDAEVTAWHDRRAERDRATVAAQRAAAAADQTSRRHWWRRLITHDRTRPERHPGTQ